MKLSLYHIKNEYLAACEKYFDNECSEIKQFNLDHLHDKFEEKALNVAAYYKNIQKEIEAIKEYEKDMHARRKNLENRAESLKSYIKSSMVECQINKIKGLEITLSIQSSPVSVVVDDIESLPEEFVLVQKSADKRALKQFLETGEYLEGARLERSTSLVIK